MKTLLKEYFSRFDINKGLILGFFILLYIFSSCNPERQKKDKSESNKCQIDLIELEKFKELRQIKLTLIDSFSLNIKRFDSHLSQLISQDFDVPKEIAITDSQLDDLIEKGINDSHCKNQMFKKDKLKPLLKWIKISELKCDNYLGQMQNYAKKDSIFRKKIGLKYTAFDSLIRSKKNKTSQEKHIPETECAKQLVSKINDVLIQYYYICKSYDEIIEFKAKQ
jgi:hypothetical protein